VADQRLRFLERSLSRFQENVRQSGEAAGASYGLIGALLLFGGLGYGFDAWRGTGPSGLIVGLLLGLVVGFYGLAKAVWRR
jgi:F0F1-type ATP synthase assembly protein I